jgi:hypothetical protein
VDPKLTTRPPVLVEGRDCILCPVEACRRGEDRHKTLAHMSREGEEGRADHLEGSRHQNQGDP